MIYQEPEVQTIAITNRRGSGKSLALTWAGWFNYSKGIPVSTNMKGMAGWATYYDDPVVLFSQPGIILADEFYVAGDNRAAMTWDVRILGYLIAQGRKLGEGKWPNHTYVALPWNLQRLRSVDIRIEPFFDWEWQPVYYKEQDMLMIYRFRIDDAKRTEYDPIIVPYPLARGYGALFKTYERLLPKRVTDRLKPVTKNVTLEAYVK